MQNEPLGEITRDDRGDGVARISYGARTIEIRIIEDELDFESTVAVAKSVVLDLEQLDNKAKEVAALELTETYNDGWNEYDEAQGDGSFKTVPNPKLTPSQFARKLTLVAVNVTGDMLDFFWGHSVVVTSMDGVTFADTHAEIFG